MQADLTMAGAAAILSLPPSCLAEGSKQRICGACGFTRHDDVRHGRPISPRDWNPSSARSVKIELALAGRDETSRPAA